MCGFSLLPIVAALLSGLGLLAMLAGFFWGLTTPGRREGVPLTVFILGIIAFALGTQLYLACG
jgi:hypothetical protein